MKDLNSFINEAKIENLIVPDYDIKQYLNTILEMWLKSVNSWQLTTLGDGYNKIALCRKCAELIYILDKFSDDITIHFVQGDKNVDDTKKSYAIYTLPDRLYNAFNVITKVMEIETPEPKLKDGESIADTVESLKKDFAALVKKYNKKYNDKLAKVEKEGALGIGDPVPCDCECCCGCECGC